ncbi:MAG: nucleoside kinase [Kiritimatiellia bacterium]|jgi:uridine kinase|nr:nucleoside kinase [Kiritimatiellia bacterium]MDP6629908.1 nucleoside kinase [Kiritimatiellia bacterium]MDP6810576.1 nucleoside kinase [Kiritimatiellia bacterium]MDP7022837.1 nucleoside kinase [Kiritimatiellia bacterium]
MQQITVSFKDGRRLECRAGTPVGSFIPEPTNGQPFLAALVNNDVASLSYPLTVNCHVSFLTLGDPHGWRVYCRSLCYVLAMAVRDLFPHAAFAVEHSFGNGLYCSFEPHDKSGTGICDEQLRGVEARMHELIADDLPIERCKLSYADALAAFEEAGLDDQYNLLRFRNPPHVVTHRCGDFWELAHGPLAAHTGALQCFRLIPYPPGFVLHMPSRGPACRLDDFEDQPHLFQIFQEHKEWGRILNVATVGRLNQIIMDGEMSRFVRRAEALHEKKLTQIADAITSRAHDVRMVLVAGPSSAGKTTFSKRLAIHLEANGLRPVTIGADDYFVPPQRNPRDEDGNPDYEHIEAVDLELFNEHMAQLIQGRPVEPPHFDFSRKERQYRGDVLQISEDEIIIVEGIHGLNPRLTGSVPSPNKFRIYVSALTQLNMDAHNRVSTTDNRLMRRIVRDYKYRGHSSLDTLRMWPSVRRGEKRWIFPFQREADATFNSALDYELAILKPMVEPLLMQVNPMHTEYAEARRLSEFLLNFLPAAVDPVPPSSILREYIGGSGLEY